jgi:hypothetical protein
LWELITSLFKLLFIIIELTGHLLQQFVGIPIGTNYVPLPVLEDLSLYSCETGFVSKNIKDKRIIYLLPRSVVWAN